MFQFTDEAALARFIEREMRAGRRYWAGFACIATLFMLSQFAL